MTVSIFVIMRCALLFLVASFLPVPCPAQGCIPSPNQSVEVIGDSMRLASGSVVPRPMPEWHSMITHLPATWAGGFQDVFRPCRIPAILGLTALTGALILTDEQTAGASQDFYNASDFNQHFSDVCAHMGDGHWHFALAGAFAVYGAIGGDNRALRTGSQIVEASLATGVLVQLIKHVTGRQRPSHATHPTGVWDFFPNPVDYHQHVPNYDAFPSGHLSATTAVVTVLFENYPEAMWLRPAGYALIGLVGFGLATKGMHWYSDFPLALVLGHLMGKLVVHPWTNVQDQTEGATGITISPVLTETGAGMALRIGL